MNVKVENVEKNLVKIEVEVDAAAVKEGFDYAFKKNAKHFRINGFRPGKAPRNIVEKVYGPECLYDDAIDYCLRTQYPLALDETGLEVVSAPQDLEVITISKEAFAFSVKAYTKPEVVLGQYKGVEIAAVSTEVTEADIEEAVKKELEKNSSLVPVEDRPVQNGDTAIIDYVGKLNGEPFEGGSAEAYSLVIGSGSFIPGFEEKLIGANAGDDVVFNITFPEEYHSADLAGKEVEFSVKVNDIKERVIPELNDDFVSDISDFETVEEYKKDLSDKLAKQKEENAKNAMLGEAVDKAIANAETDILDCMVNEEIDRRMNETENYFKRYGMDYKDYIQRMGQTIEDVRQSYKADSEKIVKARLVIEAIWNAENIEVTEEELEEQYKKMAEEAKQPVEVVKSYYEGSVEMIKNSIKHDKVLDLILSNAVKVEKTEEAAE